MAGRGGDRHRVPHLVVPEHQRPRVRALQAQPDRAERVEHPAGEEQQRAPAVPSDCTTAGSAITTIQPMPM